MSEKREHARSHETSKDEAAKSAKTKEKDTSATSSETVEYVYTFNKQTGEVMKIEELDPETSERKEVPIPSQAQAYGYDPYGGYQSYGYDPYAGYDPYGSYSYDPYGGYGGY